MVNDYWRAAIVAGAKHLHLGQEDLADADLDEIRKAGLTLGISTHDDEELATALARQTGLRRAGPDLSDHAEIDALRAAGHCQRSPNGRSASATSRWSRSAASSSNRQPRFSPPAPTSIAVVSDVTQNADPDARSHGSARRGGRVMTQLRRHLRRPTSSAQGAGARNDGDDNKYQRRIPMNIRSNPDTTLPAVTTGPLPSSRKIFVTPDEAPDLRVPLREIILSEGAGEPNLPVYDTSGPYTDPTVTIDVNAGLRAQPHRLGEGARRRRGISGPRHQAGRQRQCRRLACRKGLHRASQAAARPRRPQDHAARIRPRRHHHQGDDLRRRPAKTSAASSSSSAPRPRLPTAKALAPRCPPSSRRNSCAARSRAAAPSSPATSTTANSSR